MQPKRFERGKMYKADLFPGEAISEVLLSLYLEACDETILLNIDLELIPASAYPNHTNPDTVTYLCTNS